MKFRRELPVAAGDCWGFPFWGIQIVTELMGAQQGMGKVFSMAMPMQALDLIIVGVLWITILAATTDMLFVWAARIVTRWVPVEK